MLNIGNKLQETLILTLLILVTLMFQNPLSPYFNGVLGKIQIFDVVYPFVIIFFVKFIFKNILDRFNYFLIISIFIFLLSSIITSYFSFKHLIFIYLFSILLTMSYIRLNKQQIKKVLDYFIAFIFIILVLCLILFIYSHLTGNSTFFTQVREGFPYLNYVVRINGPFKPTAKLLSFYLLCIWPFLIIWYVYFTPKKLYFIYISLLCLIISVLTFGRSGLFTAFLYFSTIVFFLNKNEKMYKCIFLYTIFLILFLIVLVNSLIHLDFNLSNCISKPILKDTSQYYGWLYNNNSKCHLIEIIFFDNTYSILKKVSMHMWTLNPIFGHGPGSFYEYYLDFGQNDKLSTNLKYLNFYYPQSQYFLLLSEHGLFGFVIWFGIILCCFFKIASNYKIFKSNIGIIYVLCFFSTLIDLDIQNFRFFYLLIGFGLMITNSEILNKDIKNNSN